jgi:carbamoyltransferase
VFLNAVANERLVRCGAFEDVWFQPAAGDAGGAVGAALLGCHRLLGVLRSERDAPEDGQAGSLLGPAYGMGEVRAALAEVEHTELSDDELATQVARDLADGLVVGLVDGRMEFGPRALGARSILADPRRPEMAGRLNRDVKRREEFRPFAPVVLAEFAREYFVFEGASPYMLRVVPATAETAQLVPSVVHVDGSARVQTPDPGAGALRRILAAFHARTGCPNPPQHVVQPE